MLSHSLENRNYRLSIKNRFINMKALCSASTTLSDRTS